MTTYRRPSRLPRLRRPTATTDAQATSVQAEKAAEIQSAEKASLDPYIAEIISAEPIDELIEADEAGEILEFGDADSVFAEPIDELFVFEVDESGTDEPEPDDAEDQFHEPIDDHDAPVLTEPVKPLPRPEPTLISPSAAARALPPRVRPTR